MTHHFNTNIAVDYDVNVSIFIDYLKFWTFNNLANKHHIYDGFCWTYNTHEAFLKIFPFWTRKQLENIIKKAVAAGLVLKDNYNKNRYDRTCWYALSYKAYAYYEDLRQPDFAESLYLSISPKGEIDYSEWRNRSLGMETPIPVTNTVTKPFINNIGTSDEVADDEKKSLSVIPPREPKKPKPKKESFDLEKLLEDNPHCIAEQMLMDWLEVRKNKRNKVTQTAWNKINRTLSLIEQETKIKAQDAFETMVTGGWQSLELKYFINQPKNNEQKIDNNDTSWGKDFYVNNELGF